MGLCHHAESYHKVEGVSKLKCAIIMSCHSERSEDELLSEAKNLNTQSRCNQILRTAQNDTFIGEFYFDTLPSPL